MVLSKSCRTKVAETSKETVKPQLKYPSQRETHFSNSERENDGGCGRWVVAESCTELNKFSYVRVCRTSGSYRSSGRSDGVGRPVVAGNPVKTSVFGVPVVRCLADVRCLERCRTSGKRRSSGRSMKRLVGSVEKLAKRGRICGGKRWRGWGNARSTRGTTNPWNKVNKILPNQQITKIFWGSFCGEFSK